MSFSLSINAARQLGLGVEPGVTQTTLTVVYALCHYTPATESAPATYQDIQVNRVDQSITIAIPAGAASPTLPQVAQAIKDDTATKFGTAVDTVLVADTLY